jgi:hypothetical protein
MSAKKRRIVRNVLLAVGLWWSVSALVVIASVEVPKRLHGGSYGGDSTQSLTAVEPTAASPVALN